MYKLGTNSKSNLLGIHPVLAFVVMEAIKITKQDFTVFEGLRDIERQALLVKKGRSWTMDSYHLYGLAVDLVAWVDGKASWESKYYRKIWEAMQTVIENHGLDIDNGLDLWGKDEAHWQMTGLKVTYDVRKLKKKIVNND